MPDPLHQELIRQAAEDAKAGDRDAARQKIDSVLEEDEENISAWLLLARISRDTAERRLALTNILQIDPNNATAQRLLSRLDAESSRDEVIEGVSRRQFRLLVAAGAGFILIVALLTVTIVTNQRNAEAERQRVATQQALRPTLLARTAQAVASEEAAVVINLTATQVAMVSPTPTPSPTINRPTLPPSFTPTPAPEDNAPTALAPVPQDAGGLLFGWRGRDLRGNNVLPIVAYDLTTGEVAFQIGEEEGSFVDVSLDGQNIIFGQPIPGRSVLDVVITNRGGIPISSPLDSASDAGFLVSTMPDYAPGGNFVTFIGTSLNTNTDEVYLANLTPESAAVTPLTGDEANYSFPAVSPDGSQVVAVRTAPETGEVDLVLIDTATLSQTFLTSDQNAMQETTPRWSPDGSLIAYAAAPADDPDNHDLFLAAAGDSGSGFKIIEDPADDIHPVFSPDGRYLAFASNRTLSYDIFVYNLSAQELFQLTNDDLEDYPGGWSNN